jgi:plastocyanin
MKPLILGALLMAVGTVVVGAELVSAQVAKVSITREESKPKAVEIKAGQEVQFINNTGGQAHVMFAGQDAVMFYVGKSDSRIKFQKPGCFGCFPRTAVTSRPTDHSAATS